ncbi:MAG: hypothetical protein AAF383_11945 [Cyanobacteria bacterium P01_A01_bin.83]
MINPEESYEFTTKSKSNKAGNKGFITSSTLNLYAFTTAFFSRIIDTLGAPSIINFIHFAVIPLACIITLLTSKHNNKERIRTTNLVLGALFLLLITIIVSAIVNEAGMINVILDFMLLAEPFIFLVSIIYVPISAAKFIRLKKWVFRCFWIHLSLVFIQKYILKTDTWAWLGMEGADRIQGAFFISGAGHVVGCSVSLMFAVYYFAQAKKSPMWLRILVVILAMWNIIIADGKQVLFAFMLAMVLLFLIKLNDITAVFQYLIGGAILGIVLWWCIANVPAFAAFNTWIRPEIYGPDGDATLLKTSVFRIIPTHYDSILNYFFGLGPGHTVGRLGGWMLPKYADLLEPLGSTIHPASKEAWQAVGSSWLGNQSSMFSPLFGWAGIWGDLGFMGLAAYLYLCFIVWQRICVTDITRFFMLTVFVFGWIFSQMEEPGYMLSVSYILGIHYQEHMINKTKSQY